jgi:hypothetical protein
LWSKLGMDFGLMENDRIQGVRSHEACGAQVVRHNEDNLVKSQQ